MRTLFDKVWTAHEVVAETPDTPAVLYIDLHLIHEVTSPQAFSVLKSLGLPVRRPDRTLATMDHSTPTSTDQVFGKVPIKVDAAAKQVRQLEENAAEFGVELYGMRDARRGIVHVISPELGATQPGMTIVCGDSHTSTHGTFGALAVGIGTTEVGHVFATQSLLQRKPKTFAVNVEGRLRPGVTAKDLILAVIGKVGVSGGTGHVFEYRGPTIRAKAGDPAFDKALRYMGFHGGDAMLGKPVDVVFIGSCTNGRLADLQAAARILKGRKVAPGVRLLIVPGSQQVKREAEAAGYADIFKAAGADWRESGCSMCLGMNGDTVAAGQYSISTSNRNFEGRQGVGARTLLVSPFTAAASAVKGRITDPREML